MSLPRTHAAARACDLFLALGKRLLRIARGARTMHRIDEGSAMGRAARIAHVLALGAALAAFAEPAAAQTADLFDTSAANLLVVLRESRGDNKQDESLQPFGKVRATLADGHDVEVDTSWYRYLGDMH